MEDADFVADSDEDEQELLAALAATEVEIARRNKLLAAGAEAAAGDSNTAALAGDNDGVLANNQESTNQYPLLQGARQVQQEEGHEAGSGRSPATSEAHFNGEEGQSELFGAEGEEEEEEEAVGEDNEPDAAQPDAAASSQLEVGTLVEVESRTWPGINKPGGSGRIVRVHREKGEDGVAETLFFDVRYVLGGIEKHIESEFVQSSRILEQQSNREPVPRDFYHDDYINAPYRQKQREAAERRELEAAHATPKAPPIVRGSKRKRSHRLVAAVKSGDPTTSEAASSSDEDADGVTGANAVTAPNIGEDMFFLGSRSTTSLEVSSRPLRDEELPSGNISAAPISGVAVHKHKRRKASHRRQHRIVESDEENSDNEERVERMRPDSEAGRSDERSAVLGNAEHKRKRHHHRGRRRSRGSVQHYVGGYIHDGDDPDANFIQPEGNPAALPDDVARGTHLRLETTKEGLKMQLDDVFAQQKKKIADFYEEQAKVNQKMKNLAGMPSDDLQGLYRKVCELKNFVKISLVRGGEDVMNTIIGELTKKRGKLSDVLELALEGWKEDANACSVWVRGAIEAVEGACARREVQLPIEEAAQATYSSDSSRGDYSSDEREAADLLRETTQQPTEYGADSDEPDYSFEFEPVETNRKQRRGLTDRYPDLESHQLIPVKSAKRQRRRKIVSSTSLDDYGFLRFSATRRETENGFRSNLRLVGKQRNITPSDPRWNWSKLARQKQQRAATRELSSSLSRSAGMRVNSSRTVGTTEEVQSTMKRSREDRGSVQARRLQLRDKRYQSTRKTQPWTQDAFRVVAPSYPAFIDTPTPIYEATPEKRQQPAGPSNPTIHPSSTKMQPVNWETIFGVISDDSSISGGSVHPISRQRRQTFAEFGHTICGPSTPLDLFADEDFAGFDTVVVRRTSRLRQLMNDLRLREVIFLESLAQQGLAADDDDGYTSSPEWTSLVALEEGYHSALASFAAQLVDGLEDVPPEMLPGCLRIILEEVATLIRQLPDCDSLFGGCLAYFFYFEVASGNAKTTPLLTSISRAYSYCLHLLTAVRSTCERLVASDTSSEQAMNDLFARILPVSRVTLAAMLFLFDLYLHLPSSHRLDGVEVNGSDQHGDESCPPPALSLWILIYDSYTSTPQSGREAVVGNGKDFWALLQTVYRQRYFEELACCYIRSEPSGGYLRQSTPVSLKNANASEDNGEVLESQLLALESTWDLLTVLTRICVDAESEERENAESDAKWAVVKDLLHPGKRDFLPFNPALHTTRNMSQEYLHFSKMYKTRVLERVLSLSKQWQPCKDVIESTIQVLWGHITQPSDDVVELPPLFKHIAVRAKQQCDTKSYLAAFIDGDNGGDLDSTTMLCKIIWVQLLKLEKRVHRSRFRRSVLNAIPSPDASQPSPAPAPTPSVQTGSKTSGTSWNWGKSTPTSTPPSAATPAPVVPRASPSTVTEKERMSTSVLLTFAVIGICLECEENGDFAPGRSEKDIRYLEREVDFYCKEILRGTTGKPVCDVVASQALYVLGSLLLEKKSNEYAIIFWGLNAKLESSIKDLQAKPPVASIAVKQRDQERQRRLLQSAALSPLYLMRDLAKRLCETATGVGSSPPTAVTKSLEHILSTGLEACLNAAISKVIGVDDLKIAMEIFQLVLPRARDDPKQCLAVVPAQDEVQGGHGEFDEFEDGMADVWANVDLDGLSATWSINTCRPQVLQRITAMSNLRMAVQQLVLHYPPSDDPTFEELYAIDLLGRMLSTCEVQFIWNNVTSTSVKPRNLAPRVLSASLKYNPEKEWLGNVFLKESGATQELANAWLMGTLDVSALNSTLMPFKVKEAPFSIASGDTLTSDGVRDSNYWVMLTDGIIYHLLRNNPIGFYAMDPLILQLLREVASKCKFPQQIRANSDGLTDISVLYDLHLDVFQAFCKSAGEMWHGFAAAPSAHRQERNQFRTKTMNSQSGIFMSFLDAYKVNFRKVCGEIDQVNHSWHSFAELFLRQAGVSATGGRSYHQMDDSIKSFDKRLAGLTTMFRFMYQCMDAFLFHCGEMAIGDTNLFFDSMELLFRQVNSAEYPQAKKRLARQRSLNQRTGLRNLNEELRKGFCAPAMAFVNSVQLFFARQKYPSLLHWFAQTSEIYQTFKGGWTASPLRTLLVNMLDPDGPLGIHSYYPDDQVAGEAQCDADVRDIRREAFYLSCGLFICNDTSSFEHSRARHIISPDKKERLGQLRAFILNDFMQETVDYAAQEGVTCLHETMVPMCQFVRAVLNHANLNLNIRDEAASPSERCCAINETPNRWDFQLGEARACLECIAECLIKSVSAEEAMNSTISCVLVIELCGIVCEAVAFNEHQPLPELIELLELVLSYLHSIYEALCMTSRSMDPLFAAGTMMPSIEKLNAYQFSPSGFRSTNMKQVAIPGVQAQRDSYGISLMRARTDLLTGIRRTVQQCKQSSDERLRGAVLAS